jgi:hypothetical protein
MVGHHEVMAFVSFQQISMISHKNVFVFTGISSFIVSFFVATSTTRSLALIYSEPFRLMLEAGQWRDLCALFNLE